MDQHHLTPWLYPQDAFWAWMQQTPHMHPAIQAMPTKRQAGICMVCGRETPDGIFEKWETFTDWSIFRAKDSWVTCPACWAAKVYGHVGQGDHLVIRPNGRPGNGRSYSMLLVHTTTGVMGSVPWTGDWWDIPPIRPLVAMIVRGDNPSRQHWIFHAAISLNAEGVSLLVNGNMIWLPQTTIDQWHDWMQHTLSSPESLRAALPKRKGDRALALMPWAETFYQAFPLTPTLTAPLRGLLGSLIRQRLEATWEAMQAPNQIRTEEATTP